MYVSPVGKSAKSVRSIEQRFAVAGRGLGAMPPSGDPFDFLPSLVKDSERILQGMTLFS
jgi:hypothetical protein